MVQIINKASLRAESLRLFGVARYGPVRRVVRHLWLTNTESRETGRPIFRLGLVAIIIT